MAVILHTQVIDNTGANYKQIWMHNSSMLSLKTTDPTLKDCYSGWHLIWTQLLVDKARIVATYASTLHIICHGINEIQLVNIVCECQCSDARDLTIGSEKLNFLSLARDWHDKQYSHFLYIQSLVSRVNGSFPIPWHRQFSHTPVIRCSLRVNSNSW